MDQAGEEGPAQKHCGQQDRNLAIEGLEYARGKAAKPIHLREGLTVVLGVGWLSVNPGFPPASTIPPTAKAKPQRWVFEV